MTSMLEPQCGGAVTAPSDWLRRVRAFVLDVDGTLIHGSVAIPGAVGAIDYLRRSGRRIIIATNNSLMGAAELTKHLRSLGFDVSPEEIVSVVDATAQWLAASSPGARVLVLGSPVLVDTLRAAGLDVRESETEVDYVVTGGDRSFSYAKLTVAVRAVLGGARFVATNQDGLVYEPDGPFPGGGAVAGAIAGAIGRGPDVVIGKPSTGLFQEALRRLGLPPAQCAVVGDSLSSDVATAHACGMSAILVLSGVTRRAQVEGLARPPEAILSSIADLIGY